MNKNRIIKITIRTLIYVFSIVIITGAILSLKDDDKKEFNFAKEISKQVPAILQNIYEEGYGEASIDYNDPVLLNREIFITTDLDQKTATTVMKKIIYLETLDPKEPINIYINTNGGYSGVMISNFIQTRSTPINTIALDFCCSSGAELLASGTGIRKAFTTSRIIPHIVQEEDSSDDDDNYLYSVMQIKVNIEFWKKYSKMPKEFYDIDVDKYYNFTAVDALKYGIIDEIIE